MFQSIQALIITFTLTTLTFADVFMTELTDPQNSSDAGRYVELYNNGNSDVDLSSGWKIQRWTNGNTDPTASSIKDLTGTIAAGGYYIICNDADKFSTIYGLTCDQDIGTGGAADSNGDDNMAILDASGAIADMFGVAGEDGTGTGHEFEDGRAERAEGVTAANATWNEAEWNIDNDSGGGDGNQYAPEGFDPGEWIGASGGGGDTCEDESACNTGAEGSCLYEDCAGECGGDAVVDDCGECAGSNDCIISVTFNVNMALEEVSEDGVVLYGIDGDWSTGIYMSDDGSGTFSATVNLASESFHLYKFKNGGNWEDVDNLECAWFDDPDGDGWGYWDRYLNLASVTEDDLSIGSVCFSACEDCTTEVLGCTDPLADNYNPDANVDDDSCEYSFDDPANLFFSEAAEGSSNNKYLEIYNATDGDVDLSGYSLSSCSNGCNDGMSWDYPDNVTFEAGTTVAAGDVYVVCHGSADDFIQAECDQTFTYLSNGDDVFGLTQVGSGSLLDIIGSIGDDPGSGWEVAGVSNATKDHTLVRDASVSSGNGGNWEESAGDADGSEWVVLDQNTWAYLGSHPHDFNSTCDDENACNYGEEGDCTYANEGYDCDGNAFINVTFNVNMAEQTVDTEGYGLDLYIDEPYGYHDMSDDDGDGVWSVALALVANTTYSYKFKNGDEWEVSFNDLGCGAGDTYGNRTFTSGDSDITLDSVCFNSCTDCEEACTMGDVNGDGDVNVLDIVQIVGYIVDGEADFDTACADNNGDGSIDVLDIVAIVNDIVNGRAAIGDATFAKLIKSANGLTLQADGYIGGIQMTLRHGTDFTIELNDNAWISDYSTKGNETILVIVEPSEDELFTTNGDFEIVDMIVANSHDAVRTVVVREFALSSAYPNPFNPSTTVELSVPEAGHVSLMVYNITGQLITKLADSYMDAHQYQFTWQGENVPSGMYLLRAEYAGQISTQKLMLLK